MATVDLKDVRKVYAGNVEAVKGVSIAIPDGKLCVLVGPSGCGKSTLLQDDRRAGGRSPRARSRSTARW